MTGGTVSEWKEKGNLHFKSKEYEAADRCYIKALSHSSTGILVNVLCQASLVLLKLENPTHALATAATALALAPDDPKAKHQLAKAAWILGELDLAVAICPSVTSEPSASLAMPMTDSEVSHMLTELLVAAPELGHSTIVTNDAEKEVSNAVQNSMKFLEDEDFTQALSCHKRAIGLLALPAAVLMSNRAACALKSHQYELAISLASAVIVVVPGNPKGQFRRAEALFLLGYAKLAQTSIAKAPASCARVLQNLSDHIDSAVRSKAVRTPKEVEMARSTNRALQEQLHDQSPKISAAALSRMGARLQQSLGSQVSGHNGPIDARVTTFHLKFDKQRLCPHGADVVVCKSKLEEWYENSRFTVKGTLLGTLTRAKFIRVFKMPSMTQRSHGKECLARWCLKSPPPAVGSVFDLPPNFTEIYSSGIHQSFPNSPRKSPALSVGSTHVAVGFVDLGELLFADMLQEVTDKTSNNNSSNSNSNKNNNNNNNNNITQLLTATADSAEWIGYEMSPYAVAKTTVILQMLRNNASPDAVVQVWFSSTWTESTFAAFKAAIERIVLPVVLSKDNHLPRPVLELLVLWRNTEAVNLFEARELWLESQTAVHVEVASLRDSKDQMALCAYILGGDVLTPEAKNSALVGSTVMFVFPGELGAMAIDESIFHFIPLDMLLHEREQGYDLVQAAVQLLTKRVSLLGDAVRTDRVRVEVRLGVVGLENTAVLEEIRSLRPQSVSWTNVCDYFKPYEFHDMAEYVGAQAIHHIFPMNWPTLVFGTFIIDYDNEKDRARILKHAQADVKRFGREQGLDSVFYFPAMDNPMNLTGAYLCSQLYDKWTDSFFSHASGSVQVHSSGLFPNTGLLRIPYTLHVAFSYV